MAHPYQAHREHHVERERVHHITGQHEGHRDHEHVYHRARGGRIHHGDEAEDKSLVRKMVKPAALKAHGSKAKAHPGKHHRAKGGRTKHKGKTVVNVNMPPQQPAMARPMPVPIPGPGAAAPSAPPLPPRPPMTPPGGPVPGPMMGPRATGGRIAGFATGGPVEHPKHGHMGPTGKGSAKGSRIKPPKSGIYSEGGAMAPKASVGGRGSAAARMEFTHRAAKTYHRTPPARHTP